MGYAEVSLLVKEARTQGLQGMSKTLSEYIDEPLIFGYLCNSMAQYVLDIGLEEDDDAFCHFLASSLLLYLVEQKNEFVLSELCNCISQVAKHSNGRAAIVYHNGIATLVELIGSYPESRDILWWAANALYFIARDQDGRVVAMNVAEMNKQVWCSDASSLAQLRIAAIELFFYFCV